MKNNGKSSENLVQKSSLPQWRKSQRIFTYGENFVTFSLKGF